MGQLCTHESAVFLPLEKKPPTTSVNYTRARRGSVSAEVASAVLGKPVIKNVNVKSKEAYERIIDCTKNSFLFDDLDEDQLEDIILSMVETKVKKGDLIIEEGEEGDNFYVIESGKYKVSKKGLEMLEYDDKGSFGELALMYNCPRAATITALTDGVLWAVDRCTFRNIIVASTLQKRMTHEGILDQMHVFKDLTSEKVSVIADCLHREAYPKDTTILAEGTPLDSNAKFYILEKGKIECFKTFEGEKKLVKTIEEGGFFGEVALISKLPRQADCIAKTDVCVLSLSRDAFERLMGPTETVLQDRIHEYNAFNENFQNAV